MDSWSHSQILSMLEGGNQQLSQFFERHALGPAKKSRKHVQRSCSSGNFSNDIDEVVDKRYKTKAAQFYREHLAVHVQRVAADGIYKGREAARRQSSSSNGKANSSRRSSNLRAKSSDATVTSPPPAEVKRKVRERTAHSKHDEAKHHYRCNSLPPPSLSSSGRRCAEAAAAAT
eukprot:CAMPEP_0185734894 /NCGR_PEP_ID=MMETSP1171-20130828/23756_1 /TAXON_ID=374046 /ORGANISM="Helicotheca tamensis, Strain CCMP826" /LENGTH=173 /DNA_ID=CAMNT_0028405023 /DNA_START=399 /DNA_END=920 /DNA_ORIENTATION=+